MHDRICLQNVSYKETSFFFVEEEESCEDKTCIPGPRRQDHNFHKVAIVASIINTVGNRQLFWGTCFGVLVPSSV